MDKFTLVYRVSSQKPLLEVAKRICNDQTTGTFTEVPAVAKELQNDFCADIVEVQETKVADEYQGLISIAYPIALSGYDISAIFTIAIGGASSIKIINSLMIENIIFSDQTLSHYQGPKFGIEGTYEKLAISQGPVIGGILKPNIGITPRDSARLVKALAQANIDFIKDDEKLQSPPYSHVKQRIDEIMPVIDGHQQQTGKRVIYAFNICHSDIGEIERNHDYLIKRGGDAAVINVNQVGICGLESISKFSNVILHAHTNGLAYHVRSQWGISFNVWQKVWRVLGIDHLQINGIDGKYWEDNDSVIRAFEALNQPLANLRPTLPVFCSGQWGGQVPETYRRTGKCTDLMYLGGGGIHGHPMGASGGVKAIRQAWDSCLTDQPMHEYAKTHAELAEALRYFA
ncbi:Ribulose-bisphosphate carboxylase [Vibrio nigripulchritudo SOn1]|uniref:Ribulose-bisphosphate carboxylase n=1 Tax=Vibrio nigripulchritudo SOn1 TaxID=1238450 RepID=A0AAV2VYF7_9VIBR|nr:RuBisCO large subunit C-terminal-like domain-containing protein [Vibrio nigripulchritudo]CCO49718.1 Ribulose-bisphosphate carboxylase [Vibrio nigripulchritudo SOn1]